MICICGHCAAIHDGRTLACTVQDCKCVSYQDDWMVE